MSTTGSATVASQSTIANLMVCFEALIGLTGFAVTTGLAFPNSRAQPPRCDLAGSLWSRINAAWPHRRRSDEQILVAIEDEQTVCNAYPHGYRSMEDLRERCDAISADPLGLCFLLVTALAAALVFYNRTLPMLAARDS